MILCVGESLIDMLPQPDGSYRPLPGGSVYNTALALGRLGVPTGYLWPLGNDGFAEMLLARLQAAGVATDLCPRPDLPTSLAFVSLTGAEARYVFHTQGTAGGRLDAETLPDLPGNTDALFIGGISLAQDATGAGVEALVRRLPADIPVILDANIRPPAATDGAAYRQRLQRLLARADLVKLSVEDLHWLMPGTDPDAAAATILGQGARAVLLTRGAAGASAYGPGGGRVDCSAVPTVAADSIGAGDTFNAGVLAALHDLGVLGRGGLARLGPGILGRALSQGCHAAAIAVSRPGADPPWRHELAAAMTAGGATAP